MDDSQTDYLVDRNAKHLNKTPFPKGFHNKNFPHVEITDKDTPLSQTLT